MRYTRLVFFVAAGYLASTALANEPAPVKVSITSQLTLIGNSFVHLESLENNSLILILSPGPLSSIRFASKRVPIDPGARLDVDLGLLTIPTGQQTFHIVARVFDGLQNLPAGIGPFLLEPLTVSATDITKISYDDAFLSKRVAVPDASSPANDRPLIDLGGGFTDQRGIGALAFNSSLVSAPGRNYNLQYSPVTMANAFPCVINADTVSPSCKTDLGGGTLGFGAALGTPVFRGTALLSPKSQAASPTALAVPLVANGGSVIQGKFFLKLPGPAFQAAWGWEAQAWENLGGFWIFLGWSYVGGDGSWSIPVIPVPGFQVRVEYQPANRFVQLQDPAANVYTWGDNWNLTGNVTDIGGRAADFTVNGNLPGMDKLYVGATNEWVKFYNNGMNALRDTPIQVTFPNSLASGNCTSTDSATPPNTIAWSCSKSGTGQIWIIPAHGDQSVVQHEIAHSINSFYWNGVLAPGSGGKHDLTNCFNNGIGLIEGFADFMPYWVQFDRTATSPNVSYYNMSIETLPSSTCSGQTAEMRVAAAFWDTYDYWNDGSDVNSKFDSLYYTDQAVPISLFLNNKKDTMTDYLTVMKNGQSAAVQNEFTKIYRLNTIVP